MNLSTLRGSAGVALFVALIGYSDCNAATISYTGGGADDLWSNAANWDAGVPDDNDSVIVADPSDAAQIAQSGALAEYIDVYGGGVLNVTGGDLTFGFANNRWFWIGFNTPGTVNQSGGSIVGTGNNNRVVVDTFGMYNMTGGTLDTEDLWLLDGAVLEVGGQSTLIVRDDLRVRNHDTATIRINLIGNTAPQIIIEDDFRMQGDVNLEIDTSLWTGPASIDLFQVDDRVQGDFNTVTINGVAMDPADFQFSGGSVTIPVAEPSAQVLGAIAICCLLFGSAPNFGRRMRN